MESYTKYSEKLKIKFDLDIYLIIKLYERDLNFSSLRIFIIRREVFLSFRQLQMSGRYMQQNQHNQQNKRRRHDESSVYSSNSHSMSRNIPSIKSTRGSNYQNSSTKIGELRLEGSDSLVSKV